jgi:large repetitive protein
MMAGEPVFTGPFTATVEEGLSFLTPAFDVAASGDGTGSTEGNGITYLALNISVLDNKFFAIDPLTGQIRFLQRPDFEMPLDANGDNVYSVSVVAVDSVTGLQSIQQIDITIADRPNDPTITTPNAVTVNENQTSVLDVNSVAGVGGAGAVENDGLSYEIINAGGADGGLFDIDPNTGVLTFKAAPNFEQPGDANGDNTYNVTVAVRNYNSPDTVTNQNIAVTVANVNEKPVFTGLDGNDFDGPAVYTVGDLPVRLDRDVTVSDPEFAVTNNWQGAVLTIGRQGAAVTSDSYGFNFIGVTGYSIGQGGSISGDSMSASFTIVNGVMTIRFGVGPNGTTPIGLLPPTQAFVNTVIQNITYLNPTLALGSSVNLSVTMFDGPPSVATRLSDTGIITVNVNAVANHAPIFDAFVNPIVPEDTVITGTVQAVDPDAGDTLTYSVATLGPTAPRHGSVVLNSATGAYTYTPVANYNGTDAFTVTTTDGHGGTATKVVTVTLTAVNDAPVNAIPIGDLTLAANTALNFTIPAGTFTDVDNPALALTAKLSDGSPLPSWITFNSAAGTFSGTPPTQSGGAINIVVTATDTGALSASSAFTLNIASGNNAPIVAVAMPNQTSAEDAPIAFTVPAGTFTDVETATLALTATLGDGSPLPTWLTFNATTGQFSGTPPQDFNGTINLKVTATDAGNLSVSSPFLLTLTPVNDVPVAPAAQSITTNEDVATAAIAIGATDADTDPLSYSIKAGAGPSLGAVTFNQSAGTFTYTPASNANGPDSFTILVTDGHSAPIEQVVSVTVNAINDAPVTAATSSVTGNEDTTLTGTVVATDADGDAFIFAIADPAPGSTLYGVRTIDAATGAYTYTPDENFHGSDSFTVIVSDGHGGTATQVVSVNFNSVADAPVADAAQAIDVIEDTPTLFTGIGAIDGDGDPLTYSIKPGSGPTLGTVTFDQGDGSFSYAPALNANGADSFTILITDGHSAPIEQVVSVTIDPANDAPVTAATSSITGVSGSNLSGTVTATDIDGDSLTYSISQAVGEVAVYGRVGINAVTGAYFYDPINHIGTDTFTVLVSDGNGGIAKQLVTVTVNPLNSPPVAPAAQSVTTNEDVATTAIAIGASDVNNDVLSYAIKSGAGPALGSVTFDQAAGTFTYAPTANANGTDSFTILVSDGHNAPVEQVVSMTVNAVNDAPVFTAVVNRTGNEDTAILGSVLATDIDSTTLTYSVVNTGIGAPAHGSVAINAATGAYTYAPTLNYNGADSFTVSVSDGNGGTATQAISVNVTPVNDAPVAVNDIGTATENQFKLFNLLANDSDVDNTVAQLVLQTFTVTSVGGIALTNAQARAAFSVTGNQLQFNPGTIFDSLSTGQNAIVNGTYQMRDPSGATSTATFSLTVAGVNDVITGNAANNTLNGTAGIDTISGLGGNDILNGLAGNDTLNGGAGNDTLNGGAGNDILVGGTGIDFMTGGLGADTFRFALGESVTGNISGGGGTISDVSRAQGDHIDISALDANASVSGNQAFSSLVFRTTAQGVTAAAGSIVVQSGTNVAYTTVYLHTNNDGVADLTFHLTGQQTALNHLLLSDFIL